MPKTTKPFDWEVWEGEDFVDILSLTRNEAKEYRKKNPQYTLKEIGYNDDGDGDFSRESNRQEKWNVQCVRVSGRRRKS